MGNLYGILLLSKHQLIDELVGSVEDKKERIFNELIFKNRKNKDQIIQFS